MTAFFTWYIILTLLGWLTFPLTYILFPALTNRGYTLARAAGLLIWGYAFWLLASLGAAQNDKGGILFALAILIGLSVWSLVTHHSSLITFLQSNKPLIITTEILFLVAFAFLAFVRSANSPPHSAHTGRSAACAASLATESATPPVNSNSSRRSRSDAACRAMPWASCAPTAARGSERVVAQEGERRR